MTPDDPIKYPPMEIEITPSTGVVTGERRGPVIVEPDLRMTAHELRAIEGVVEEELISLREGLTGLLTAAKGENEVAKADAVRRLKIFGSVSDSVVATRLALMNRKERRAFLAKSKKARGKINAKKLGGAGKKKERKK